MNAPVLNIGLRALTLASRFLLVFFLARFLEPGQLGLYGLLTATISYALYALGLDFYSFTTREILRRERGEWGQLLKSQAGLSITLYMVFLPLLMLVFIGELLPWSVAGWFIILLVLEHVAQELSRLLITISQQLTASFVLFLRQGVWVVVAIALMYIDSDLRSLELILAAWSVGGALAVGLGTWRISRMGILGWQRSIDWQWVMKGLRVAVPLLGATLAIRGVFTLDRYWFEILTSRDVLGAYVLFMGLCSALMAFLDAGVFAYIYPGLISAHNKGEDSVFRRGMLKLLTHTVGLSAGFTAVALISIEPILTWLDRPLYSHHQDLMYWLLSAMVLYAVGMVSHYGLYAQGKDTPIIQSHIASLVIFVLTTWSVSYSWPYIAVPVGLCAAFASILIWKTLAYFRLTSAKRIYST